METVNLSASASAWDVQIAIWNVCKDYYYKVFVSREDKLNANTASTFAGYTYTISYDDYRTDVQPVQAAGKTGSDNVNELHYAGDTTKTPTYAVDVLWDGVEDHLFFNPAPYDWFYTPHAVPQIKV